MEHLNYYATISLHSLNEKITVNFGKNNFLFNIEGFYLLQTKEKLNTIISQTVEENALDYIIREYLVHSGYQESFNAMEMERMIADGITINNNEMTSDQETENELKKDLSDLAWNNYDGMEDQLHSDYIKYSTDEIKEPEVRKRTLSLMMERMNDDCENKTPDVFLIMNFLKERKIIQNMLAGGDFDTALSFFEKHFHLYQLKKEINFKKILMCIYTLKYLERLKHNDYLNAYEVLNKLDQSFWNKDITVSLYDNEDKICDYTCEALSVLLCYEKSISNELSHFFNDKQIELISNQINSLILELPGLSSESVLEKILKQETMVNFIYNSIKNCSGEKINVKIN